MLLLTAAQNWPMVGLSPSCAASSFRERRSINMAHCMASTVLKPRSNCRLITAACPLWPLVHIARLLSCPRLQLHFLFLQRFFRPRQQSSSTFSTTLLSSLTITSPLILGYQLSLSAFPFPTVPFAPTIRASIRQTHPSLCRAG